MADPHDQYDQAVIVNLVDQPVILHADTPGIHGGELPATRRRRIVGQGVDTAFDSGGYGTGQPIQGALGGSRGMIWRRG